MSRDLTMSELKLRLDKQNQSATLETKIALSESMARARAMLRENKTT